MSQNLYKEKNQNIPAYIVQDSTLPAPNVEDWEDVSSNVADWETAQGKSGLTKLSLRCIFYEQFVMPGVWATMGSAEKKTLLRAAIWPFDVPLTELNALYTESERDVYCDLMFNEGLRYASYIDISGSHDVSINRPKNIIYVRLSGDSTINWKMWQPFEETILLIATQGHNVTFSPDFKQDVTLTLSTGANEYDAITINSLCSGLHVTSFVKNGSSL